jgi:hypothetical protein
MQIYFTLFMPTAIVSLIDHGFATHGVHMDQRLVRLEARLTLDRSCVVVKSPPNSRIYPPGPAYLYVVTDDGVPSVGQKLLLGSGVVPGHY